MFPVGRYDPGAEAAAAAAAAARRRGDGTRRSDRKRRSRDGGTEESSSPPRSSKKQQHHHGHGASSSLLRVIAPEEKPSDGNLGAKLATSRIAEEAFDDLDIEDDADAEDIIEGGGDVGAVNGRLPAETEEVEATTIKERDAEDDLDDDDDGDEAGPSASRGEIRTALRMAGLPLREAAERWKLAPFLVNNLVERDGFESFFPIQALAIPDVIAAERHSSAVRVRDACLAAPTGSGKTLAYVLPVLNALATRRVRRLRALVVLPSRDLAGQVHRVFQNYCEGSDLRVGLAIGQSSFRAEQAALTLDPDQNDGVDDDDDDAAAARHRVLCFEPGNLDAALRAFHDPTSLPSTAQPFIPPKQGRSSVDVLVCTPGRLVDHLDNTPGFTLQHLRFLVVDEADRLLSQRYHNWIDRVIESANSASTAAYRAVGAAAARHNKLPPLRPAADGCSSVVEPITWRRGGAAGDDFSDSFNTNDASSSSAAALSSVCRPVQLRKILVSATLTRDPQKLAPLRLVNPKHFDAHQLNAAARKTAARDNNPSSNKYSMPEGLDECTVECTAEQKPLVLLALLLERLEEEQQQRKKDAANNIKQGSRNIIVVFTASLDSTHRLGRLLQLLFLSGVAGTTAGGGGAAGTVAEFSSSLSQKERSVLMDRCNAADDDDDNDNSRNNPAVVVCSDGMSRGMDLSSVSCVINYDVPTFAKTYVHRCGRTARAGSRGTAVTLLKGGGQAGQFAKVRKLIQRPESVRGIGVDKGLVRGALPRYRRCVRALREVLEAEENGELNPRELDLGEFLA